MNSVFDGGRSVVPGCQHIHSHHSKYEVRLMALITMPQLSRIWGSIISSKLRKLAKCIGSVLALGFAEEWKISDDFRTNKMGTNIRPGNFGTPFLLAKDP